MCVCVEYFIETDFSASMFDDAYRMRNKYRPRKRTGGNRADGNYHACNDRAVLMTDGLAQNVTAGINRWRAVTTPEGKNARRQRRPGLRGKTKLIDDCGR